MKRFLFITVLLGLVVSACVPAEPTEPPVFIIQQPVETLFVQTSTPESAVPNQPSAGPAEQAVIKRLAANLRVRESDISILRSEEVEFNDSCLGMVIENIPCAQVMSPGYTIVLETGGLQYEYRASRDGNRIQPVTLALVWKREGGVAGFCDVLTVFLSGEVFATKCAPEDGVESTPDPDDIKIGTFANLLNTAEKTKLNNWIITLAQANLDSSDPVGVADRMEVTLTLHGNGSKPATQSEQKAIFKFAQDLYTKVAR